MKEIQNIEYQYINLKFDGLEESRISTWIHEVVDRESHGIGVLTFIFCDDGYLLALNRQYLQHDYLTDVITFDYCEEFGAVSGDVFISIPRVAENAEQLQLRFLDELYRVMVHGVLHLLGYSDKDAADASKMREKENYYLSLLS